MANTYSPMVATVVANRMLTKLRQMLIPFSAITTDFSSEVAEQGDTVDVPVVATPPVAGSLSGDHGGSYVTAASGDTSTNKKTVTLNQDPVSGFNITDREAAAIESGRLLAFTAAKIDGHARSVALHMLNYVFNLLTFANVGEGTNLGAASTFNFQDLSLLKAVLTKAGWDKFLTTIVLDPDYVAYLEIDNNDAYKDKFVYPILEAPTLPPVGGTPESENLIGFGVLPDAIAMAMRIVEPQSMDGDVVAFDVIEDEETGIAIGYRQTVRDGKVYHTLDNLYGANIVDGDKIHPLRSDVSGN